MKTKRLILTSLLALGFAGFAHAAGYQPITLTPSSFNFDVVVEATYPSIPFQNAVTVTMDSGPGSANNTWFELGADLQNSTTAQPFGLPHANTLVTNRFLSDHVYRMPPTYIGNCAVFIGNYTNIPAGFANTYQTGAFVPTVPAAYNTLSLLLSAGNGPEVITCVVMHSDGVSETNSIIGPDWFGGFNGTTGAYTGNQAGTTLVPVEAFSALGRANTGGFANLNSQTACVLWSLDIPLTDTASTVTNVNFTWVSGGRACIFALSGSTGSGFSPIAVTGYDGDPVLEATILPLPYNATMDNGTNVSAGGAGANTWYEVGWDSAAPTTGFPLHNSILTSTNTGRPYQMAASYTGPMSALVDTNHQLVNIVPASPQAYTAFSLLTAGASIGGANTMSNIIILQHSDGVNETNIFNGFDWFNDNIPAAYTANGRVSFNNAARSIQNLNSDYPRLFESQFQMQDTTSPVTNIQLRYYNPGSNYGVNWTTYVMAVSATAGGVNIVIGTNTTAQNIYASQTANFTVGLQFGTTPSYQWQSGPAGGPFVNLANGATGSGSTVSGATTPSLSVANVSSSDVKYYQCVVTNAVSTNTSIPAPLTLLVSTLADVTQPGDILTDFGEAVPSPAGLTLPNVIDGTMATYLNYGASGTTTGPFTGPVGIIVTPQLGSTIVSALRFVNAVNASICDPADYMLDGSNDGGNTWTPIVADTPLALPDTRNIINSGPVNVTNQALQEVDFPNTTHYTTYRLTIQSVKTAATANSMQIAEIQFLGTQASIAPGFFQQPAASETVFVGANVTMSVIADGPTPITYQWSGPSGVIAGATSASFTLNNAQTANTGNYSCAAHNAFGTTVSSSLALTVLAAPNGYVSAVTGDHPVAYWRLDEAEVGGGDTGVVANDYEGGHNGIYTNVALGQTGYSTFDTDTAMAVGTLNTSPSFMGGVSGINFAAPTNSNGAFTIEAWASGNQPTATAQLPGAGIICLGYGGGGEQFAIDCGSTSNDFRFYFREAGGGSINANSLVGATNNTWHHLVGVLDEANNNQRFYVDGQLVASNSLAVGAGVLNVSSPTNAFTVGTRSATTATPTFTNQFQGSIDEVAIYNYALTTAQVQNHYFASGIAAAFITTPTNTTANEGTTATFFSQANGTPPLSYQWSQSVDGGATFQALSGQTSPNLVLNNVSHTQNGYIYEVTVNNGIGSPVTSPEATLTVLSGAPTITTDLQPAYTVSYGFSLTLSVGVGGTSPFAYGWRFNGTPLSDGGGITGSHSSILTIANAALSESGNYQLFVTNGSGTTNSIITAVTVEPFLSFNGPGVGWSLNGGALFVANNNVQLTDGGGSEAKGSFFGTPLDITAFEATWTYQETNSGGPDSGADGMAFVVQNDPRGAAALGGGGGQLGYTGITPSAALEFNIYSPNNIGIAFDANGAIGPNTSTGTLDIAGGNPINVTLIYANGSASLSLTDTVAHTTFTTSASLNLPSIVGTNRAFVGFTGATGGVASSQNVSNFAFFNLFELSAQVVGSNIIVVWPTGSNEWGLYTLQKKSVLGTGAWSNVTQPVTVVGGMNQVTIPLSGTQSYYRLQLQ